VRLIDSRTICLISCFVHFLHRPKKRTQNPDNYSGVGWFSFFWNLRTFSLPQRPGRFTKVEMLLYGPFLLPMWKPLWFAMKIKNRPKTKTLNLKREAYRLRPPDPQGTEKTKNVTDFTFMSRGQLWCALATLRMAPLNISTPYLVFGPCSFYSLPVHFSN